MQVYKRFIIAIILAFASSTTLSINADTKDSDITTSNQTPYEIWLMSGPDCNICDIFTTVRKQRGYADNLRFEKQKLPIKTINKLAIPENVQTYFSERNKNNADWFLQLTIAIIDNKSNKVLYSGNIAESVDWRHCLIDQQYMRPPAEESLENLQQYGFNYSEFFKQQFNLEYFVEKALKNRLSRIFTADIKLRSLDNASHDIRTSLWGTAAHPARNGVFIATRLKQIKNLIKPPSAFTVYTNGTDSTARDTLLKDDNTYRFIQSGINAQFSADFSGLNDWFSHIATGQQARHLIIQVGHSGPTGIPVWGNALTLSKNALKNAIEDTGKAVALVSGACHSGQFAQAGACGFYAAHPKAIATGCQVSLAAINASDDYLKYFFLSDQQTLDTDNNQAVTFNEAHWYASSQLERHNVSYSDMDAEVDAYFATAAKKLPDEISLKALAAMVKNLSQAEQTAFTALRQSVSDDTMRINLNNYVSLHQQAIERLRTATELSSAERNQLSGLAYPLNLVLLARRALFQQAGQRFSQSVIACGEQSLTDYVQLVSSK